MIKKTVLSLTIAALFAGPTVGQTKYGEAAVTKGKLYVVRNNRVLTFDADSGSIPIRKQDIVRVGDKSHAVLRTVENSRIKMGGNSVFQIKPWRRGKSVGLLRMLYGRNAFRTNRRADEKKEFRFVTATATVDAGGKGGEAEGLVEVSSSANTQVVTLKGEPAFQGLSGTAKAIPANHVSFTVGGGQSSYPIQLHGDTPPTVEMEGLGKDSPTMPESVSIDGHATGVGVAFTDREFDESNRETVSADEPIPEEIPNDPADDAYFQDNPEESDAPAEEELDVAVDFTDPELEDVADFDIPDVDIEDITDTATQQSLTKKAKIRPIFP